MSYDEDEEAEVSFKMGADEDELGEPLDMPEEIPDLGLDDDPDDKYH